MCIPNSEEKKLFNCCDCSYPSARDNGCEYCIDPKEVSWIKKDVEFLAFAFSTISVISLIFSVFLFFKKELEFGGLFSVLTIAFLIFSLFVIGKYHEARKGTVVKIFLDNKGFLHCHGDREKFSGHSTGFEISDTQGKIRSIPLNVWRDAYAFDGQSMLEIHYGEIPTKKCLSKMYSKEMSDFQVEKIFPVYYLKIINMDKYFHFLTEDFNGNTCYFYPGEILKLLHNGFKRDHRFNKIILQSDENARNVNDLLEKLTGMREFTNHSVRDQKYVANFLSKLFSEKKRVSEFALHITPAIARALENSIGAAKICETSNHDAMEILKQLNKILAEKHMLDCPPD